MNDSEEGESFCNHNLRFIGLIIVFTLLFLHQAYCLLEVIRVGVLVAKYVPDSAEDRVDFTLRDFFLGEMMLDEGDKVRVAVLLRMEIKIIVYGGAS